MAGAIAYNNKIYATGGGGGKAYGGTATPTAGIGKNGDYYYQYDGETSEVRIIYVKLDGEWHKIDGGDVIIYEGEATYSEKPYVMPLVSDLAQEGEISDE